MSNRCCPAIININGFASKEPFIHAGIWDTGLNEKSAYLTDCAVCTVKFLKGHSMKQLGLGLTQNTGDSSFFVVPLTLQ